MGCEPVQSPSWAVRISPRLGRAGGRRRDDADGRRGIDRDADARGGGGRAGVVGGGHHDAHDGADVVAAQRVGRVGRADEVDAVVAERVAALPLVGVEQRLRAGPGAVVGGQRLAVHAVAGDGGQRRCWQGGSTVTAALGAVAAPVTPPALEAVTSARMVRVDVGRGQRVRAARLAGDRHAVGARAVAALPHDVEVDRRRAGPGAGVERERAALGRGAGEGRGGRVGRRVGDHGAGRGRVGGRVAGDVGGGDLDADAPVHVGAGQRVGRGGRAGDVGAVRAVGVAALPLVGVGERGRAGPGPVGGRDDLAVAQHAGDGGERGVDRRVGVDRGRRRGGGGGVAGVVGGRDRRCGRSSRRRRRSARSSRPWRRRCRRSWRRARRSAATARRSRAARCRSSRRSWWSASGRRGRLR